INGSGKHNNWSLLTNTGVNLFSPGKTSKGNLQFLTFFLNTIATVFKNQDLLRSCILTGSNSHRLGANEAPPAILSVFTGSKIAETITRLVETLGDDLSTGGKTTLQHGIGRLPEILLDNTDRNRTSPFAFTGNRFEFRAVGSKTNSASPMTILNAAMAVQLKEFKADVDAAIKGGVKKDEAIINELRKIAIASKAIIFNGDGYSDEWVKEAARRGLTNITSVPDSVSKYLDEQSKKVLVFGGIMSEKELEARVEVEMEKYVKLLQIEGRVLGDLAVNHIVPTAVRYLTSLIDNVKGLGDIFEGEQLEKLAAGRKELIIEISDHIDGIKNQVTKLRQVRGECNEIENESQKAYAYEKDVRPCMDAVRFHADELELIVDDEMWPLPKYREMLFFR
ncbi:MAG: glutamine synthetase type III, partial [Bacteroidales bacterium]|nr:glutamine synthetase type III [Bacteroidales bacterium]